jgi:hypothetical protein
MSANVRLELAMQEKKEMEKTNTDLRNENEMLKEELREKGKELDGKLQEVVKKLKFETILGDRVRMIDGEIEVLRKKKEKYQKKIKKQNIEGKKKERYQRRIKESEVKERELSQAKDFLIDFEVELELENKAQRMGKGQKERGKKMEEGKEKQEMREKAKAGEKNGADWIFRMTKAFGAGMEIDNTTLLSMWLLHFCKEERNKIVVESRRRKGEILGRQSGKKESIAVDLLRVLLDTDEDGAIENLVQIPAEEMAVLLNSCNLSKHKFSVIQSRVTARLDSAGVGELNCFPEMQEVKKCQQEQEERLMNLFDMNVNLLKKQKDSGVACCRVASLVEWICRDVVGVKDMGKAATWKIHTDARAIQKGLQQVVFSIQPVGLPLLHFSESATKGLVSGPASNKQWAKDSSYLVFPFLVFKGKETKEAFLSSIPPTVFSDLVRLEHDGLQFDRKDGDIGRGYLPACESKSVKWCGGVLYEMCGKTSLPGWRAADDMSNSCDEERGGEVWNAIDVEKEEEGSFQKRIFDGVELKREMLVEDAMGVYLHFHPNWGWRICELSVADELLKKNELKRNSDREKKADIEQYPEKRTRIYSEEQEEEEHLPQRTKTYPLEEYLRRKKQSEKERERVYRERECADDGGGGGVGKLSDDGSEQSDKKELGEKKEDEEHLPQRTKTYPLEEYLRRRDQSERERERVSRERESDDDGGVDGGGDGGVDGGSDCGVVELTYEHYCVFVMCGDLASMWSLFGFCGGPSGSEQCPLCTLARVDQWRGAGITVTKRKRASDVPIPLSPDARYVMCLLHCTMRIGEFAMEKLIMNCINQKQGKHVGIGKMSKKKKLSVLCLDPTIAYMNKGEMIQEIRKKLREQSNDEESINPWKKKKPLIKWLKNDLCKALDKLMIEKLLRSSKLARDKCQELNDMDLRALKTLRAKTHSVLPQTRSTKFLLEHDLFCHWYQNEGLFLIPEQETDQRERGSGVRNATGGKEDVRDTERVTGRGRGTGRGKGRGNVKETWKGRGNGRGKETGRGRGTGRGICTERGRGKERGSGRGSEKEARKGEREERNTIEMPSGGVRRSTRNRKIKKKDDEWGCFEEENDEDFMLALGMSLSGEDSSSNLSLGKGELSSDTASDIFFNQSSSADVSFVKSGIFSGDEVTSDISSLGNFSDIESLTDSDFSFVPITFSEGTEALSSPPRLTPFSILTNQFQTGFLPLKLQLQVFQQLIFLGQWPTMKD